MSGPGSSAFLFSDGVISCGQWAGMEVFVRGFLTIGAIVAGLAACSTPRPVNYGFIDYIGDSRQALEAEYGPPRSEEVSADGETVLIYAFAFPGNADPQAVLSDGMAAVADSGDVGEHLLCQIAFAVDSAQTVTAVTLDSERCQRRRGR